MSDAGPGTGTEPGRGPTTAGVQDYILDGKDNYAADRDIARAMEDAVPGWRRAVWDSRAFAFRAVMHAGYEGVTQVVDLGCGYPVPGSETHEAARGIDEAARVAYVDSDPLVAAYARALLVPDGKVTVVQRDLADADAVIKEASSVIDFAEPLCLVLSGVLHFLPAQAAYSAVAAWRHRVAPGSYLVISHPGNDADGLTNAERAAARRAYAGTGAMFRSYAASTIAHHYFADWAMTAPAQVTPGVVPVGLWRTDQQQPGRPLILGGVAVKQ